MKKKGKRIITKITTEENRMKTYMLRWRGLMALTAALLLGSATGLQAQWTQTGGPAGARVTDVAADESARIAIVDGDVLHWTNDAWEVVGELPRISEGTNPRSDSRTMTLVDGVLLIHHRGHLLRSTDYGITFDNVGEASAVFTDGTYFYTLTDDPNHETPPVLARSQDGESFSPVGTLPMFSGTPVAWEGKLYTRFGYGNDIFRSDDGGQSWDTLRADLPREWRETSAGGTSIGGLAASSHGLYATAGAEVFRSTDGEKWTNVSGNLPEPMMINGVTANDSYLYVRDQQNRAFSYSVEEDSWSKLDAPIVRDLIATDEGAIVITATGGLLGYDQGATTGTDLNGGLIRTRVYAMGAVDDVVLANAEGLVYRSEDGGETWDLVPALEGWTMVNFCTNEANGEVYLLDGSSQFGEPLRSTDQGKTWEEFGPYYEWDPTWRRADVHTVVVTEDGLFAAISEYGPSKASGEWRAGGVYRSEDNGDTWQKVDNGLPYNVETTVPIADIIAVDDNLVVTTPAGTFRSDNGGDSWVPAMNGMSAEDMEKPGGALFAIGSTIYKKTVNGFYESEDYGKNWTAIELDLPTGLEYTYNLFSLDGEIYMQSYKPSTSAPLGYFDYHLIKFDGKEWKDITDWQPEGVVFTDMVRAGDTYFAGTQGDGVWALSRDFSVGASSVRENHPVTTALELTAAPNPASDRITIDLAVAHRSYVDISLVDPVGRTVAAIHRGEIDAGTHTFDLSTTGLAIGMWYVRTMTAHGETIVRSVRIVR